MKTLYTKNTHRKQSKHKLLLFELIFFFICMFIAALAEAQTVSSFSPADGATDVDINTNILIIFDQDITVQDPTESILFLNASDGFSTIFDLQLDDPEVTVHSDRIFIDPPGGLPRDSQINVRVNPGAIENVAILTYDFTTEYCPVPGGGTSFSLESTHNTVTITPNSIGEGNGQLVVMRESHTTSRIDPTQGINYTASAVYGAGDQTGTGNYVVADDLSSGPITVTNVPSGTQFTIQVYEFNSDVGCAAYNTLVGGGFGITTFGEAPAVITSLTPEDNATDVPYFPVGSSDQITFTIEFDKAVAVRPGASMRVYDYDTDTDLGQIFSFNISGGGTTTPNFALSTTTLPEGGHYYILFDASFFQSPAAGPTFMTPAISDKDEWNFTTGFVDEDPPVIQSFDPADDATDIALSNTAFTITFDEPVFPRTSSFIHLRLPNAVTVESIDLNGPNVSFSGNSVTFTPTVTLLEGQDYYFALNNGALEDMFGNVHSGFFESDTWNFTTIGVADVTPPVVQTTSPADDAVDVAIDTDLVISFDEDVRSTGSGSAYIRRKINNGLLANLPLNNPSFATFSGNTLTIDPPNDLPEDADVYVTIDANAIEDLRDNAYPGWTDNETWDFTTVSSIDPPLVTSLFPANEATDVFINTNIQVFHDQSVQVGTGFVRVRRFSDDALIGSYNVQGSEVTTSGTVLLINPDIDFPYGTELYVEIDAGAVESTAGDPGLAMTKGTFSFTTESLSDVTPPSPVSFSPSNNAEEVAVDRWDYSVTFNEPIQLTGTLGLSFQLRDASDALIAEASDDGVTISGNTLSVDFNHDGELNSDVLDHSTFYHIEIDAGYIEDLAGNDYDGFASNTVWQFETIEAPDNEPPTVASLTPSNGTTDVAINANLVIQFNEDIYLDNDAGTFELRRKSPDALVEAFDIFGPRITGGNNSETITIDPTNDLEYDTEYYFLIGGNDVIIDLNDNAFAGFSTDSDWSFTTLAAPDITPPSVTGFSPMDEATGASISDNLQVVFNEDVQSTGITVFARVWRKSDGGIIQNLQTNDPAVFSYSGNTLTINPPNDLPNNEEVYITIPGASIEDLNGNDFGGFTDSDTWNFTVGIIDNTAPVVTAFSPLDEASNVATDPVLTVTFDEPVFEGLGSGNNIIIREADGTLFEFFQITDARVSGLGTNTLTLNPDGSFSNGTSYYITFPASIVEDAQENGIPGWLDDQTWNFLVGTIDTTPPQVVSYSPLDDALNQATDIDLILTFDEGVKLGAPNVVIKDYLTDAVVVNNGAISVSISGDQVTLDPISDLSDDTHYYVEISAGSFTDLQDNPHAGISDKDTWDFVVGVPDNQSPQVLSLTPADDATGVSQDASLVINFDEPVFAGLGSGNSIIIREANASLFEFFSVTDARVSGLGTNTLTLNPDNDFDPNTSYYVTLPSQVVEDANANGIAGWLDDQTWSFTTGSNDNTAPSIASMSPMDNAVDVPLDTDFTFTFDEDITFAGTGTDKRVRLFTSSGSSAGIYSINDVFSSVSGRTITINPADLSAGESYYITIDAGYVKDLAGNDFAGLTGNTAWNFTATDPDVTAPTVQSFSPADDATDVAMNTDLSITFDEPVFEGAGSGNNIFIRRANSTAFEFFQVTDARVNGLGTNVLTFNPTNDLEPNTSYYVTLPVQVVEDAEGNGIDGWLDANTWSFTTGSNDNTAPSIASMSPMDDETDVPLDTDFTFTFDEDITFAGTGTDKRVRVFRSSGASAGFYSINDVFSSVSGRTVTINPPDLIEGESYYITIDAGYVKDLSGNDFPGLNGNTSWNFTAIDPDVTAPQVLSFSPGDNSTNVAIDSDLTITFDEGVFEGAGSGNNIFIRRADATVFEFFQVTDARVSGLGTNALTINPVSDLEYNTSYYVTLPTSVVEDGADNGISGWSDAGTWNFTTEASPDNTPPSTIAFSPAHQSTDVAVDIGQLQMTFDEDIQKTNPGNIILRDFDNNLIAQYFPAFDDADVSVSGNVLTMALPGDLSYETSYYVQFISGTVADLAGNNFPGFNDASTWIFTTGETPDIDPPVFVSLSPSDDELNVSTTANLEITFDEDVFSTNHPINVIRIVDFNTDQSVEVFDPDENGNGRVTIAGNVITLNPTDDLLHDNQYYVIFNDDILQDANGNVMPGYNNNFTWNFTTEADLSDVTPPSIISLSPADNSIDVDPDTNLEIEFDEEVFLGNSSFLIRYYDNNVNQYTIPYNSGNVSVNGSSVTIELPGSLQGETHYWIQINANTITDAAGNGFPGILIPNRDDWDFTTAGKLDQTITFETIPEKTFGDAPFMLNASASSGLPVTFDVVNGPVSVDGNEVTILGTGSVSIRADQEGNGEYNPAVVEIRSFNIAKADQTISFNEILDRTFGDTDFDLSATSSSGLNVTMSVVSGPVSLNGNTVTINGAGTAVIAANQSGNDNYNAANEVQQTFEIRKADQVIIIDLIEDKLVSAEPFEVSASINSGFELEYEIAGPASLSETTITLDGTAGTVTVTASQAGNENYNEASESVSFEVIEKSSQTISFDEISDKIFGDAAFDLIAIASSGLSVEYSVINGPVSISGNTVTITGAGSVTIAANQSGNDAFEAAVEVQQSFTIEKADQTIAIDPIDDKVTTDAAFDVVGSVDSGLELSYEVTGPATIDGTTITLDGTTGTVTVTVSQAGNDNYNSSTATTDFEVTEEVTLSVADQIKIDFYPNPASDFINIDSEEELKIRILNLNGQEVKNVAIQSGKIDVSDLASGSYILEMKTSDRIINKRIIKAN